MLNYKLLEALKYVIEEGGFARAAEVMCLTQSAVSQRVRMLEDQSGQILLKRSSPPRPTAAGRSLYKHFRQVLLLEQGLETACKDSPASLSVGVNADSLACWFAPVLEPLLESGFMIDLRVEDQENTHEFLRNGDVIGCISTEQNPIQGCRAIHLGAMKYHLMATPAFVAKWFAEGFTVESAIRAPTVQYDHNDRLQRDYFRQAHGIQVPGFVSHYVPSPEKVYWLVGMGHAYGLLPELPPDEMFNFKHLVKLQPEKPHLVNLYWHCWNLESDALKQLTRCLIELGPF